MQRTFAPGTTFIPVGGKAKKPLHTVKDVLRTYNLKGELIDIRYLCTHDFCGQTVTSRDVVAVTIQRGLVNGLYLD